MFNSFSRSKDFLSTGSSSFVDPHSRVPTDSGGGRPTSGTEGFRKAHSFIRDPPFVLKLHVLLSKGV